MTKTLTLDFETTGLVPKDAKYDTHYDQFPYPVSLAYKINDAETKYIILNQQGRKIPWEATAIHGITNEMCAESSTTFMDAITEMLYEITGATRVIGHNLYYDISVMKANILRQQPRVSDDFISQVWAIFDKERRLDTMYKTIKLVGKMPKLTELYMKLFGETFNAHNAKGDVDATYRCYCELIRIGHIQ